MLVQAKPFWALLLTAVMVCAYLPLEPDSVLQNQNEPRFVLPDREAYDWSVTVTHANGSSYSHHRSNASNTMSVYQLTGNAGGGGKLNITVDLIDNQTSVWDSSIDKVRVLIGLLKVPNATTNNPMEDRAGWLMQATEGELDRPNDSKNSLSLELVQDEVESGACYLVHIRAGLRGYTDTTAPTIGHPTFIVQPLYIEYAGSSCPLRDSDGDGYTDVQENLANSNPNSSSSVPNMTTATAMASLTCTTMPTAPKAVGPQTPRRTMTGTDAKTTTRTRKMTMMTTMASSTKMSRLQQITASVWWKFSLYDYDGDGCLDFIETKIPTTMNVRWERIIHQRYCPNCIQLRCRA